MNKSVCYLWLNLKDITADKKARLISFFGDIEKVYSADAADYRDTGFLSSENIVLLSDKNTSFAEAEYKKCADLGIEIITFDDSDYPPALAEIHDPPVLLYARGDTSLLQNRLSFCFVGSRKCSEYGLTQTMKFATHLASRGFVIVSGCALGIDSAAHKGALVAHGKTIGVAGCGLDVDYPYGNRPLREDIAKNGLLISEFPLSTPAHSFNFPIRNRILSGLSLGVAVMEAGNRSGSLITAEYAISQNKDLYALPGNIDSIYSAGSNSLIHDGCEMLLDPDTIVSEYLERYSECFVPRDMPKEMTISETVEEIVMNPQNALSDDEKGILRLLKKGEVHIDYIASALRLPTSKVMSLLTILQIKKLVLETPGKYYKLYP